MQKNVYFLSDFHLFSDTDASSTSSVREKHIVSFLKSIEEACGIIHLVGDVFDYWFEYRNVVPKGAVRLLGQLAYMYDQGWEIHYHIGNHDLWQRTYLQSEIGAIIHTKPFEINYFGKNFFICHGDGLGKGDIKYKMMKKILHASINKWLFSLIHPDMGLRIMKYASYRSRLSHQDGPITDTSKEIMFQYANQHCKNSNVDYYVFGHRHQAVKLNLENGKAFYVCLGDWLNFCTYAVISEDAELCIHSYPYNKYIIK
jgi:UDP-2,3-diacylglucosamine hydrolase